jgi:hypothetical protein
MAEKKASNAANPPAEAPMPTTAILSVSCPAVSGGLADFLAVMGDPHLA